jgi:acyl carrier protein phosphodiesterase
MNFLAHAYLSFENPQILAGNMISDFVKGAKKNDYPKDVRQGIELHRAIDQFTDEHPATREAALIFRPHYRLYSGALVDVLYDHFLANDPEQFSDESLQAFTQATYKALEEQASVLPIRFVQVLAYMKADDWLYNYRYYRGIEQSLHGLVRRAAYLEESATAYRLFREHYSTLQSCYQTFFPHVKLFAKQRLASLLH